jgi:hypothetical protein
MSKDTPFSSAFPFTGLWRDLQELTVSLPPKKKAKYRAAIAEWNLSKIHALQDVEESYGKLLHACLIIPPGRAYFTNLESILGIFHDTPHKPRTPLAGTAADLQWWDGLLSPTSLCRPIPGPCEILDYEAFSDASSGIGIGIVIKGRWRAWRLLPGWQSAERDIGWAEAVGFCAIE